MKNKLNYTVFVVFSVIALILSACSSSDASDNPRAAGTSSDATTTSVDQTANEVADEPASTEIAEDTASADCIVGIWNVDHVSLQDKLSQAINSEDRILFEIGEVSGSLFLIFDEQSNFEMKSEDLQVEAIFNPGGYAIKQDITFAITAVGLASYSTKDGSISILDSNYNLTPEEFFLAMGQLSAQKTTYSIEINPNLFMSYLVNSGDSNHPPTIYQCNENELHLISNYNGSTLFNRE